MGRGAGAARAVGDRSRPRPLPPPQLFRLSRTDECGYPEARDALRGDFDEEASPLGAKGLGELVAVSVAPAIANAVYHATGKRVRDLPIAMEKLL